MRLDIAHQIINQNFRNLHIMSNKYDCSILIGLLVITTVVWFAIFDYSPYRVFACNFDTVVGGGRTQEIANFTYSKLVMDGECRKYGKYKMLVERTLFDDMTCIVNEDECYEYDYIKQLIGKPAQISLDTSCPEICDTVPYTSKKAVKAYEAIQKQSYEIIVSYVVVFILPFFLHSTKTRTHTHLYVEIGSNPEPV
jgi:hypothetical protein